MKYYALNLRPRQPLHLPDPSCIEGRMIRGMVAAAALRTCRTGLGEHDHETGPCCPTCLYWHLFNPKGRGVRFGHGYPVTGAVERVTPYLPTTFTCSAQPGFRSTERHGITDHLIRGWLYESAMSVGWIVYTPYEWRCSLCNAPLLPMEGNLWRLGGTHYSSATLTTLSVTTTHQPHSAPHAFQQTGFTLPSGMYYTARLTVPEPLDGVLRAVLSREMWIGKHRTRGMGEVTIELSTLPDPTLDLHERISAFNKALRGERRFYAGMDERATPEDDGTWYFTLDFPEGASLDRSRPVLSEIRGLRGVELVRAWLTERVSMGRHIASGLPARGITVSAGVILARVPPEVDRPQIEMALRVLESQGLGADTERGWGAVMACDPFHLQIEPI